MSDSGPSGVTWSNVLAGLVAGEEQSRERAAQVMREVMSGNADPIAIAGWLVGMQAKGVTADEIAGCVETMVAHAERVEVEGPLLDTCGTGGDGASTLNVSTLGALVVAAAGVRVAKHGNRAASGVCGAADLLEAWGLAIELEASAVATTIEELGIGFMFARTFHPAMRHVGPVRSVLGIPTIFNILGPLSNPAGASHQLVGVANPQLAPVMAEALARLGRRALVVRGRDGIDELTITGPSDTWDVRDGQVIRGTFDPAEAGIEAQPLDAAIVTTVEEATAAADAVLDGAPGPGSDLVALNAGAALYVAEAAASIPDGVERAREVLASGDARRLRDRWVSRSRELA
ncbi:MAG: anthranilate phosphoribosyltransferase [Nitriliruptorales bacterium]|nr:anthranilate phosphoribosyltransferase [Nitriliruptorales bacterium]